MEDEMNNLSWLIYFADTLDSLNVLAGLTLFVAALLCLFSIGVAVVNGEGVWRHFPKAFYVVVGSALVAILTPSSTTIYAIAASEMGESALKSATGGKAIKALNAWFDRQISEKPEQK
jgi:hypothetical protein